MNLILASTTEKINDGIYEQCRQTEKHLKAGGFPSPSD